MIHYDFLCFNKEKKQYFQGSVAAADVDDLIVQLSKHDLSLSSYSQKISAEFISGDAVAQIQPIARNLAEQLFRKHQLEMQAAPTEQAVPLSSLIHDFSEKADAFWQRRTRLESIVVWTIGIIFGGGFGLGVTLWYLNRPQPIPPELELIAPKYKQLNLYMNRGAVEKIFPTRAPGVQLSTVTVYSDSGFLIEVWYDLGGGPWSDQNWIQRYVLKAGDDLAKTGFSRPTPSSK